MATLTVWKFDTADGADRAVEILRDLVDDDALTLHDAATVSWPSDRKKPKTRQLSNLAGKGALGGAFWGLLFGLLFFVPVIGIAVGAATGAAAGALSDVGIDDSFIDKVRSEVTPGTSALFALTSDADMDKVGPAFEGFHPTLIQSNLAAEDEARLMETFGED
jgi:uncharacterized membrane protein